MCVSSAKLTVVSSSTIPEKVVIKQIRDDAKCLNEMEHDSGQCKNLARKMKSAIPQVQRRLDRLVDELRNDPDLSSANEKSNKILALLNLLAHNFRKHAGSYRGIVFVEQVALVSTLARAINVALDSVRVRCGAVAGVGHQTESDRQEQLRLFEAGECRILVTTATLEEGIDVSTCEFVARFNFVPTTKAHIQGSGR